MQILLLPSNSLLHRNSSRYNPPLDSTCGLNLNDFAFRVPTKDWHKTRRISVDQFECLLVKVWSNEDFPCLILVWFGRIMDYHANLRMIQNSSCVTVVPHLQNKTIIFLKAVYHLYCRNVNFILPKCGMTKKSLVTKIVKDPWSWDLTLSDIPTLPISTELLSDRPI